MAGRLPKDIEVLIRKLYKNKDIPVVNPKTRRMKLGYPVLFVYDAKFKNKLPYWDSLPLSIVLARYPDGFLGINLHYIIWTRRLQLGKFLVRRAKNKNRIRYEDILKAWKNAKLPLGLAQLCIRRYLFSHIRSDVKQFSWETYYEAVREIRPKFRKKSEQYILNHIMKIFREKAGKK